MRPPGSGSPIRSGDAESTRVLQPADQLRGQRFLSLVAKDTADRLLALNEHLGSGTITPVIDRSHPIAEVHDAFRHLESGPAHGVTVITT